MKLLFCTVILFLSVTTVIYAQTTAAENPTVSLEIAFATFTGLVAAIPIIVEFLKNLFGKTSETSNTIVQILSWLTGIVVTLIGWYFKLGFLVELEWWMALLYGFGASLAANGVADTKLIQAIISLFRKK